MKISPLNIRSALDNSPPELDFVLPGLLSGTAGTIVGSGGVGKSTLLLQLSMALSTNTHATEAIFPISKQPSRVVFIAAEESLDILNIRLHFIDGWMKKQQAQTSLQLVERAESRMALLEQNLCVVPAAGHPVYLVKNGEPTEFFEELCQSCKGARLIIIDPLRRLHDGDENSSAAMTQVVQVLESLGRRTGAAVIVAHHMNKGAAFGGTTDLAAASRGSSALTDAVRWQVNLSSMTETEAKNYGIADERGSYLRLDFAKANYIAPQPTIWLKRLEGGVLTRANLKKSFSTERINTQKTKSKAHRTGEKDYV